MTSQRAVWTTLGLLSLGLVALTLAPRQRVARRAVTIGHDEGSVRSVLDSLSPGHPLRRARIDLAAAPGDRGTELHAELEEPVRGGVVGDVVARVRGEQPGQQLSQELSRLKQHLETGEVVVSEATLHRDGRRTLRQLSAQPHPAEARA